MQDHLTNDDSGGHGVGPLPGEKDVGAYSEAFRLAHERAEDVEFRTNEIVAAYELGALFEKPTLEHLGALFVLLDMLAEDIDSLSRLREQLAENARRLSHIRQGVGS